MNVHVPKKRLISRVAALSQSDAAPSPSVIFDPSKLPDQYGMICEGLCLEPEIADGSPVRAPIVIAETAHLPAWLIQVNRNAKFRTLYTRSSGRLAGSFGA